MRLVGRHDPQAAAAYREQWQQRANLVRERLAVSMVVGRVVTLRKANREFVGLCPFHNEKTPSFTVSDRKGFFHCFGCGAHGDAVGFVMQRQGLGYREAVELLESENGLRHLQAAAPKPAPVKARQVVDERKAEAVRRIWGQTVALTAGGLVDRYLRGRCLVPPAEYGLADPAINAGWPPDLRYHGALWHPDAKRELPAMVAAQRRADGSLGAIHRTYLRTCNVDVVKAGTERDKMMLGEVGGTVIRLAEFAERMVGGEGIETSLSAMQLFRRAGLAFGQRANMAAVEPPFICSNFIYAADRNKAHPDPKHSRVGEAAAYKAKEAWGRGRTISVKVPRLAPGATGDFNDVLVARQASAASVSVSAEGRNRESSHSADKTKVPQQPSTLPARPTAPAAQSRAAGGAVDRRSLFEGARDAKREEDLAFKRYAAAGVALDKADPMDLRAHEAAQLELDLATRAWKSASQAYERARARTIA